MYAILSTCGKQYKIQQGDELFLDRMDAEEGSEIIFDSVLAVSTDNGLKVGSDVAGAKVKATVVKHGKGPKIVIFKYKSKKDYRKKQGHRQPYTKVKIESILA